MDQIAAFCRARHLLLIEDCAHAVGAEWNGKMAGTFGDTGCFSFYPTKILTSGEGGMLITNRDDIGTFARAMQHRGRDFAQTAELYRYPGRNIRMPEVSALLGRVQLGRLPENLARRREIANAYTQAFSAAKSIQTPHVVSGSRSAYWKYPIFLSKDIDRDAVLASLHQDKVMADKSYDPPVHLQPFFLSKYPQEESSLAPTNEIISHHICLPCHDRLSDEDVTYVTEAVFRALGKLG
jgi:dTDP-4-amino-4,6-dideoxygalactose transaminase